MGLDLLTLTDLLEIGSTIAFLGVHHFNFIKCVVVLVVYLSVLQVGVE